MTAARTVAAAERGRDDQGNPTVDPVTLGRSGSGHQPIRLAVEVP